VDITVNGRVVAIKGKKGTLQHTLPDSVEMVRKDNELTFAYNAGDMSSNALAGTARALISNMVNGVSNGYEKKLTLVGVGYRAQVQGKNLGLTLGFSHPVNFPIPEGITIETPSQTEILVKGVDKQKVGLVSSKIRAYRPPEPYKGKGIRYADEVIILKEAKKK
jgi:large subunit ribosomal protein L6